MSVDYFHSKKVFWNQGVIHLQSARWHSCQQWGWDKINSGERLAYWLDYWVLSVRVGDRGWSWQWWPQKSRRMVNR